MSRADWIRGAAVSRDLIMVAVGVLLLTQTPPSVDQFSPSHVVSNVWASALVAGGFVSGYGVMMRKVMAETVGCFTVGGGFLIWAIAAVSRENATATSVAVGLVFLAGAVGQVFRGLAAPFVATAITLTPEGEE